VTHTPVEIASLEHTTFDNDLAMKDKPSAANRKEEFLLLDRFGFKSLIPVTSVNKLLPRS